MPLFENLCHYSALGWEGLRKGSKPEDLPKAIFSKLSG